MTAAPKCITFPATCQPCSASQGESCHHLASSINVRVISCMILTRPRALPGWASVRLWALQRCFCDRFVSYLVLAPCLLLCFFEFMASSFISLLLSLWLVGIHLLMQGWGHSFLLLYAVLGRGSGKDANILLIWSRLLCRGEWVCTLCRSLTQPEMEYDCENARYSHSGVRALPGLSTYDQKVGRVLGIEFSM